MDVCGWTEGHNGHQVQTVSVRSGPCTSPLWRSVRRTGSGGLNMGAWPWTDTWWYTSTPPQAGLLGLIKCAKYSHIQKREKVGLNFILAQAKMSIRLTRKSKMGWKILSSWGRNYLPHIWKCNMCFCFFQTNTEHTYFLWNLCAGWGFVCFRS